METTYILPAEMDDGGSDGSTALHAKRTFPPAHLTLSRRTPRWWEAVGNGDEAQRGNNF
jgi:hypothetical protein